MANQKVYNIVINGIKESISEVDVLSNQLDNLEKRLKNLGKEGIKLDKSQVKNINAQFEADTLYTVELIDVDTIDASRFEVMEAED